MQKAFWERNSHKCLCRAVPPRVLSPEGIAALFPIQPFPPEHLALCELPAHYSCHFTTSSKICLTNNWAIKKVHIFCSQWTTAPSLYPLWNPDLVWAWPNPNSVSTESSWRIPFSKLKPGDVSMSFIKSPPPSAKVVKLLQTLSAGSPQKQQARKIYSKLLEIAQIKEKHCQLNSRWRGAVRLFSGAEHPAPAFGSAAISWPNTVFWKWALLCWSARHHPRQAAFPELQCFSKGKKTL